LPVASIKSEFVVPAALLPERAATWHRLQLVGDGFGHLTFDQKDVGQFAITARSLKLANPLRPIPFWQSNFRPQALQLPAGRLFLYLERASNRFYLRASPEHHRASLDSWRRIWDWK